MISLLGSARRMRWIYLFFCSQKFELDDIKMTERVELLVFENEWINYIAFIIHF